jgi:heme exporter protein A
MRLIAEKITCVRGGRQVFADLSFSIDKGQALVVMGPNGAGKSSLLRLVAGLLRPAAGHLRLEGGSDASIGEQAHYLGHLDAVKGALSILENLSFWADYLGHEGDLRRALENVDLHRLADLPAGYLSAGQKRRLAIARLIAVRRPIWLLDEPVASLDAAAQAALASLMRDHLRDGGLIVAASHGPIGLGRARTLELGAP